MRFHHEFSVPMSADDAWKALGDIEKFAPHLPGTTLHQASDGSFTGVTTIKLGKLSLQYTGTGHVTQRDDVARRSVFELRGAERNGQGPVRATLTATLKPVSTKETKVLLDTDLKLAGAAAAMGRQRTGQMGSQFVGSVATGLADQLRKRGVGPGAARTGADVPGNGGARASDDIGDVRFTPATPPGSFAAGGVYLKKDRTDDASTGGESGSTTAGPAGSDDAATPGANSSTTGSTAGAPGDRASDATTDEPPAAWARKMADGWDRERVDRVAGKTKDALKNPAVAGAVGVAAGALATWARATRHRGV